MYQSKDEQSVDDDFLSGTLLIRPLSFLPFCRRTPSKLMRTLHIPSFSSHPSWSCFRSRSVLGLTGWAGAPCVDKAYVSFDQPLPFPSPRLAYLCEPVNAAGTKVVVCRDATTAWVRPSFLHSTDGTDR